MNTNNTNSNSNVTFGSISPEALTEVHDLAVAMQPSKLRILSNSNGRCCG